MHELTELIKKDMAPALGVTEPDAIAFCVAKTRTLIGGELIHVNVAMNSGMFKNVFTCGIPNSREVGNVFAAALGYVAGDAAFESVEFALSGVHIDNVHGINGFTPEDTMRNMGRIASPGMVMTEKTIVEIQQEKLQS